MVDKKIEIICNGVDYKKRSDSFFDSFYVPLSLNEKSSGIIVLDFYNLISDSHLVKLAFALTGKNHGQNTSRVLKESFDISLPEDISKVMEARRKFSHEFVSYHNLSDIKLDKEIYDLCDYDQVENPNSTRSYSGFEDFIITKIEEYYLNNLNNYLNKFIKQLEVDGVVFKNKDAYLKMVSECISKMLKIDSDHRVKLKMEKEKIYEEVGSSISVEIC